MAMFFKHIKKDARELWIYSVCFIVIFNFAFLPRVVHGGETFGMFIISSFLLQLITVALYLLMISAVRYSWVTHPDKIVKAIILFFVFEIILFFFIGNISFFGLFEHPFQNVSKSLQHDILAFHKKRDFAFSMSSLVSVIIYFIGTAIAGRRKAIHQEQH